jgi:hypothetical protein
MTTNFPVSMQSSYTSRSRRRHFEIAPDEFMKSFNWKGRATCAATKSRRRGLRGDGSPSAGVGGRALWSGSSPDRDWARKQPACRQVQQLAEPRLFRRLNVDEGPATLDQLREGGEGSTGCLGLCCLPICHQGRMLHEFAGNFSHDVQLPTGFSHCRRVPELLPISRGTAGQTGLLKM